ncbi:MAG: hypothetical protein QHH02_00055 [Syntrophomonadaceae bacterium]|nr:hypothetical protein [Syntrophomonadaceae bacterium]
MVEKEKPTSEDYLTALRSKLLETPNFKTKLIGGVDEEDVLRYVSTIEQKYQNEFNQLVGEREAFTKQVAELKKEIEQLKNKAEAAEIEKNALAQQAEKQRAMREQLEKELEAERARVPDFKFSGFKDEIEAVYKQLENLAEKVKVNTDLQQQLEIERLRAEKAEKNQARLTRWLSELKERFYSDQAELEFKIMEIEEKHKAFQSEINNLLTSLQNFRVSAGTQIDELCAAAEDNSSEGPAGDFSELNKLSYC